MKKTIVFVAAALLSGAAFAEGTGTAAPATETKPAAAAATATEQAAPAAEAGKDAKMMTEKKGHAHKAGKKGEKKH